VRARLLDINKHSGWTVRQEAMDRLRALEIDKNIAKKI